MLNVARDESITKETRLAAIRRLNEISPEYLGNLDLERIKTEDAAKAVDLYVQSLIAKQNIENANLKKTELLQQRDEVLKMELIAVLWKIFGSMLNIAVLILLTEL